MQIVKGKETEYAKYVKTNSRDGYSKGVVDYSERWAVAMEREIANLPDNSDTRLTRFFVDRAESLSHEADIEGITGFMYGCAVQALAQFWKHGETLRRWHNLSTQMRDEGERANERGGVLNPAVIDMV